MALSPALANTKEVNRVATIKNGQLTDLEHFQQTFKLVNVRTTLLRDTNHQYLVVGEYPANSLDTNPFFLMDCMSLTFNLEGVLNAKKDSDN